MQRAIATVLRRYGIEPLRQRCVAKLDCEVWRIGPRRPIAAAPGGDLALRIYAPDRKALAPIEAEMRWLSALAAEGVQVPRPLPDLEGRIIQAWPSTAGSSPRHAVLLDWLPGRMLDRGLRPEHLRRLGVLTARLHATAARLAEAEAFATRRLAYTADLPLWASGERPRVECLPQSLRTLTRKAALRLADELAGYPVDHGAWSFVHGDLHPWNVLFHRGEAGAIDFSDCGWGHRALDLASTMQYLKYPLAGNHDHRPHYMALQASLLAGYAEVLPLPPDVARQIESYLAARFFVTLEWMLDDWPRLDHRAWGLGFLAGAGQVFSDYLAS